MTTADVLEVQDAGHRVLCPRCRSPLVVVLDPEVAQRMGLYFGTYCERDPDQLSIVAHLRPPAGYWEKFEKDPPGTVGDAPLQQT